VQQQLQQRPMFRLRLLLRPLLLPLTSNQRPKTAEVGVAARKTTKTGLRRLFLERKRGTVAVTTASVFRLMLLARMLH
jgi:hypothetical protein